MLEKIVLHNYRCFENSEIRFRKTAILVGNNNAGKSSLVEALRIVGVASQKFKKAKYIPAPDIFHLPAITKGFKINLDNLKIDLRTVVHRYKTDTYAEIKAYFCENICIKILLTQDLVFAIVENGKTTVTSRTQAVKISDLELQVMPQIGLIREDEPRLSNETVKNDMHTRLSSRHFRNELLLYHDHFETFKEIAQETWPGLRISDVSYSFGENISLLVTDDDYASEIGLMGSGLQMWLQIIWFVSRCPETATVVLDEPDVYMHPDMQRKILKIVQRRFSQVVIATHSIEIISGVEPREIVTVDKKSRKMTYANSYRAVQDVISNLGSEHNLSLVRLGNVKKCVFVEGKDIQTLVKLQSVLFPDSQFAVDQLPTVSLGGWSRFNEALGAARLFYEETAGEIETYCILDRDYHTDDEVSKLYQQAEDNHLQLHIWARKELENYLLSPRAFAKIAGVAQDGPDFAAFCDALYQELDKLRDDTRGKLLDQLCLQDRSKNPSYFLPELEKLFSPKWETLDGRLSIACGKDVISLVNQWMREKYNKSSSRAKIIRVLTPDDIADEMKTVIHQLLQS